MAGFFNYLYHVVLAHVLGPGDYGDLATFLNVTTFLVLPGPVITLLYTRIGRREKGRGKRESWLLWGGGLGLWVLLAFFSPVLGQMLHISSLLLLVFSLEVVPTFALAANLGILQRVRWYLWVGVLTVLMSAFRVLAAAIAAFLRMYPLLVVGLLEGLAVFVTFAVSRRWAARAPWAGEAFKADVISGTAVVGVINVLLAISDGLLAKHSLSPLSAGRFTGMATIGHTIQFLSGSFGTVMLTSIMADPEHRLRFVGMTLLVYASLGGIGQFLFLTRARWVVMTILGRHFAPIVPWISYYGWGMISLGFINIAMLYSVALKRWEVIATTGLGLTAWIWRLLRAHSVGSFVRDTTSTMVIILLATVIIMVVVEMRGGQSHWRKRVRMSGE